MDCEVNIEEGKVHIRDLEFEDEDVAAYFKEFSGEELCGAVVGSVKVGVLCMKTAQTSGDIHLIEKAFNELHSKFGEKLEDYLGAEGILADLFDEQNKASAISKIADAVEGQLDPNEEGTALFNMKRDMIREIRDLKERLGIAEATQELYEKTAIKGREIQEKVYEEIDQMARAFEDAVEFTGDLKGRKIRCKTGDIVVVINPEDTGGVDARIVFEVKDTGVTLSGKKTIFHELDEAMENRDSVVGVAVISYGRTPEAVCNFRRYPPDKILCSYDTEDEECLALELAYKQARWDAMNQLKAEKVRADIQEVRGLLRKAEKKLERVTSIKSTLTSVTKGIDAVKGEIDLLREEVRDTLREIDGKLTQDEGSETREQ
jgi:hypothetical protein